ncbi:MAG: hypothetical protein HFG17_01845 [Oscillospiraceae bacterium]|jgi:V/A-type H+-transporting ATPase subunit E|nr:hypothetical protein [Oscillospiraceae bacterium]
MPQNEEKLELFRQAILEKANAQKEAVRQETEARKKKMLDEEESKLLESFYRETQTKIQKIKAQNIKELGQESTRLKRELYAQREQYVNEILARVRADLVAFTQSETYGDFLEKKAEKLCTQWPGGILRLRPDDIPFRDRLEKFGRPVETDSGIHLGGLILYDPEKGAVIDESLDAALEAQKGWFQRNSGFQTEGGQE